MLGKVKVAPPKGLDFPGKSGADEFFRVKCPGVILDQPGKGLPKREVRGKAAGPDGCRTSPAAIQLL